MVFSTETIKAAANKQKAYYNKINECIETEYIDIDSPIIITENNYRSTLEKYIVDGRNSIMAIFANSIDTINNRFRTKADYIALRNPDIIRTISNEIDNIDSIDLSCISTDIVCLNKRFAPESHLIKIRHTISSLKEFILALNNIGRFNNNPDINEIIDDYVSNINSESIDIPSNYDFLTYSTDNILDSDQLKNRHILATVNYGKMLNNNSQYVTDYLNDLATSLRELPPIELSENLPTLIRSKIMSVVSYKMKLINQILKELYNYSLSYIRSSEIIADQNIAIANYIYSGRKNVIDANKVDTEYELDESALFNSLLSSYEEACDGINELDSIVESVGLIAIQEANNLNLMQYVQKVMKSIQEVWTKFKNKMKDLRDRAVKKFTTKFKQNAENLPDDLQFEVQNVPELNTNHFNMIKVIPFDFEAMKDSLRSQDSFVQKFYPGINRNEGETLKAAFERFLLAGEKNVRVTKDYIMNTVIPILETSDNTVENSAKDDVEIINKSTEAISRLSSNPNGTTTTTVNTTEDIPSTATEISTDSYKFKSGSVIKEDDVKFVDDANRTATADRHSVLKDISIYLSVSATVLSTKLKLIRKKEITAFRILAHAFAPPRKQEGK